MVKNKGDKVITLDTFFDPVTADLAKGKLEQNGITSFLEDKNNTSSNLLAEIQLMVLAKDLKKSFEILSK